MKQSIIILIFLIAATGCIGTDVIDDLVPEKIEITNPIMSLKVGESYPLMFRYLDHVGDTASAEVSWVSDNQNTLAVDGNGKVTALQMGSAMISVTLASNDSIMDYLLIEASDQTVVVESTEKSGSINTTSSYELSGEFVISNIDDGVEISIADNYVASEALPGLYVYLSNNPSTVSGALEIGEVTVFSGAHNYVVTEENLSVDTYAYLLYFCKPFNVKVGHGEILD